MCLRRDPHLETLTYGFGAETSQAALAHRNINFTIHYVAADVEMARVALTKVGAALGKRTG